MCMVLFCFFGGEKTRACFCCFFPGRGTYSFWGRKLVFGLKSQQGIVRAGVGNHIFDWIPFEKHPLHSVLEHLVCAKDPVRNSQRPWFAYSRKGGLLT